MLSSNHHDRSGASSPATPSHSHHAFQDQVTQAQRGISPSRTTPGLAPSQLDRRPSAQIASLPHQRLADHDHQPVQEYHNAFSDALSSPSRPSQHQRQSSFPSLLPFAIRNRAYSPERRNPQQQPDEMPFTGDGVRRNSEATKGGGIAGWFSGSASTSPTRGNGSPARTPDATPISPRGAMGLHSESPTPKTSAPTGAASKFSLLAASMTATLSRLTQSPSSPSLHDELLNVDVELLLFPNGPPTERDTFSPAAFKNLQANAVGLVTKMQTAYRQQTLVSRDLQAEKDALREEQEEAETRALHLKMQLEGMARKAAQQEREMKALMDELVAERLARAEEKAMREKGMAGLVDPPMSEGSLVSEDLGFDDEHQRSKKKWRKSLKSDGSYDTDEDESVEDESVFSRSRSPTIGPGNYEGAASLDGTAPVSHPRVAALGQGRQKPAPPMNALQKLVKNVTGAGGAAEDEFGPDGCRNCKGQDASVAWNTVSVLRDENKQLKQQVGQLETAVEGALDLVNGVGLDLR